MAIDTREKRMSIPGVGRPWMRSHDTAVIDEQWRIGVGLAYNGNNLIASAPVENIKQRLMILNPGKMMH